MDARNVELWTQLRGSAAHGAAWAFEGYVAGAGDVVGRADGEGWSQDRMTLRKQSPDPYAAGWTCG